MKLVICATEDSKNELLAQDLNNNTSLHWIKRPEDLSDRKMRMDFLTWLLMGRVKGLRY